METIDDLRRHLALAIRVEMSTIPPYLYAMYSIEDQGSDAALLIRSIVAEEMLHAALAANLLVAVGGEPKFGDASYFPTYPMDLPHHRPPLRLDLAPCSPELIRDVFMRIEQPEVHDAPANLDEYESLGQFYHALEMGIAEVDGRIDLFAEPSVHRQMANPSFYAPVTFDAADSGGLMAVDSLESADAAIEVIIHQGEGLSDDKWADPDHQELTHYRKLLQIEEGTSALGTVRPLRTNPKTADYPEDVASVSSLFNCLYRTVFLTLDRIYSGDPEQQKAVGVLYLVMGDLMSRAAHFLVELDLGDGTNAAPTFEYHELRSEDPVDELQDLADRAASHFPELASISDAVKGLQLML